MIWTLLLIGYFNGQGPAPIMMQVHFDQRAACEATLERINRDGLVAYNRNWTSQPRWSFAGCVQTRNSQ